jgi:hypothetical protein
MDSRRFLKPFVAAILAVRVLSLCAAPADAGTAGTPKNGTTHTHTTNDTGWG